MKTRIHYFQEIWQHKEQISSLFCNSAEVGEKEIWSSLEAFMALLGSRLF